MAVIISGVEPDSLADRHGIQSGHTLLQIDGHDIGDVLDYRFYMAEETPVLQLRDETGALYEKFLRKPEAEDLGLLFDTYLMDEQRRCKNACIFCFIDQLPEGLRPSLYFKDDDSRMSFLYGNYVTLTNLAEKDIARIIAMHISPVNISVHTMNPALRVKMMKNPRAGEALGYLPRLAESGVRINAQLVLCPGYNDSDELLYSLRELQKLGEALQSVAAVPVGLTKYRQKLPPLRLFTKEEAREVIRQIGRFGDEMKQQTGRRVFFASDEFYITGGLPLPEMEYYEDFDQLENGVGMLSLLAGEFREAMEEIPAYASARRVSIATGRAAYPCIMRLAKNAMDRYGGLQVAVLPVDNDFFGEDITVAGLLTGEDLAARLTGLDLGEELLLSSHMLRAEQDLFLDGMTREDLAERLGTPVRFVESTGGALLDALLGPRVKR